MIYDEFKKSYYNEKESIHDTTVEKLWNDMKTYDNEYSSVKKITRMILVLHHSSSDA